MTQEEAYSYFFPEIRDNGQEYYKTCLIYAYPATLNQYIETWTADGLETTNYAKEGDFVVRNLQTECQEEYIVPWGAVYIPQGKIIACRYYGSEVEFVAKWGRLMSLKPGDYIVSPSPNYTEVYRIASQEFFETYEKLIVPE